MKPTLPGSGVPWTRVPNLLVDGLMPTLRDTELRVLLLLLRSTVGYERPGAYVRVPYRALTLRTGRGTEAVANALASLRERGLIHVDPPVPLRKPKPRAPQTERTTDKDK